jgi:hypothetical protein
VLAWLLGMAGAVAQGQTFQITGATYAPTGNATIPAGVNGVQLVLSGTLPSAAQQSAMGLLGCFYTGSGSTAGLPLSAPTSDTTEPLAVSASTIQSIPQANFTAANGYAITALVYFIQSPATCDGTFNAALTNQFPVTIAAPSLSAYAGALNIPQTNSSTGLQAPPATLTLGATGLLANSASGGTTAIAFGSFGNVTAVTHPSAVSVAVPAAFASSPAATTASLSVCNVFPGDTVCIVPTPAIVLTVSSLASSAGTLTATPSPVSTAQQTVLTAQFAAATGQTGSPGAPSGLVSFASAGTRLPAVKLSLDKTATFSQQTTTVTVPMAATPVIHPAGGNFSASQTVSITDATPGAAIYYTQDGSTPSSASTLYTGAFSVSSSETVNAIAVAAGQLNSAVATATFTIAPPTQLAFTVQPTTTSINAAVTPPVQVAIEDTDGSVATGSSAPVTLALLANSCETTLAGTTTENAVNGIATFANLSLNSVATGCALQATSSGLQSATSTPFNVTLPAINMTVQSTLVGIASTLNGSFTLAQPAPSGGLVVSLTSSSSNVTIAPASVTLTAGQTTGAFTYTGVTAGAATLSASAPNYQTGTVQATATAAQVSLGTIPSVAPGQMTSLALSLPEAAPPGGTTVTFTIGNSSIATVTSSVTVPAGHFTASINPQVTGVLIGTTTVTASAPGFAPAVRTVNVTVTATFNPQTTNINLITSTNTVLDISAPAPAGGIKFTLSSDNPAIATVPASVTVTLGATDVQVPITGVSSGTTTIRADSPGITEATGTVNIVSTIVVPNTVTGVKMEQYAYISLPVAPSVPTTVTVTSLNPAVATLSKTDTAVGTASITFTDVTSTGVGYIYVQGQTQGTAMMTVAAAGYTTGTGTNTVDPSGFIFNPYNGSFTTTTYSAPNSGTVNTTVFDATSGAYMGYGYELNPGLSPINVPLSSSNPAVGTITNPAVLTSGSTGVNVTFQPLSPGTSNLKVGTPPAPFSVPNYYQTVVATVVQPQIAVMNVTTGVNLQNSTYIYLPEPPPSGVSVTVSVPSSGQSIVAISSSPTTVGGTSVTFAGVTSTSGMYVYLQGLSVGTTTLTVSAPGYASGAINVTVDPSGFIINYYQGNFSTQTNSGTTTLGIYTAVLNPSGSGSPLSASLEGVALSPGVSPVTVQVTSSNTSVGTLTPTSVVFNPGDTNQTTAFQPVGAGTTTIAVTTPDGYSTSTDYESLVATVSVPNFAILFNGGGTTTGVNLEASGDYVYLTTAPTSPISVTVTSSDPTKATISTSPTAVGTTSVTFANVTTTSVGSVYLQGKGLGTATLTASATGYTSATNMVTVDASGFGYYPYVGTNYSFTTTTFSQPTGLTYGTFVLDPTSFAFINYGLPLNPGAAPVSLDLASSSSSVGTIASPLVFTANVGQLSANFQPVSAGTTSITNNTPAGYSTPAQYQSIAATVTAPVISVSNVETGINLENSLSINLPQTPPNPVTVTVTSNGPAIATISNSGTVMGGTTLTFTNVTSTNVGTIYVQGQSIGSTIITVSAPGYTNGTGNVTVDQSGFSFYYDSSSFSTTTTSTPTTLYVCPSSLTPGTLTVINPNLQVNPGIGTVNVPVVSSDLLVGTITTSSLAFTGGDGYLTTSFQPLAPGTTNITASTPTTPAGFSAPSNYNQITATVTP